MKPNSKQWSLIGLVVALLITSITYRIISGYGHSHSGLMFVGLPAILSVLLILSNSNSASTSGQVFKGVTLFLLMMGILAWEGLICILMAAPIFYLLAFTVQWIVSLIKNISRMYSFAGVLIVFLALEGTHQSLELDRKNRVEIVRVFEMGESELLDQLSNAPDFSLSVPAFFRMGFPTPLACQAEGSFQEDDAVRYRVRFTGPKDFENELHVHATRVAHNEIEFDFVEDSTKIGSWMTWEKAFLEWVVEEETVIVTWSVVFQRNLDPYWYFSPIQNYAVGLASNYLLNTWTHEPN